MNVEKITALITALEAQMPENFRWNFTVALQQDTDCGSAGCAMGLAVVMGIAPRARARAVALALDIDADVAYNIFVPKTPDEWDDDDYLWGEGPSREEFVATLPYGGVECKDITPQMVAAKLRALLNEEPA